MSKIEVNAIEPQCGTTLTLGASGDTVTLGSGASQSGFGRTGTVDWDTTAKTASFTAVSGNGYFVNTTSGAVTVTLPASPSSGDIVALQDYAGTWGTNNVTIGRNGSNVGGVAGDAILSTSDQSITLVYVDATRGWQTVNDSTQSVALAQYVTATGGTITTCGDYKIHTFTGPGTFCVSCGGNPIGSETVSYMVVAGGGGGGGGSNSNFRSAGGGAGGFRESKATSDDYTASPLNATSGPTFNLPVSAQGYPITVGAGGAGGQYPPGTPGVDGSNSIFSTITSTGGGTGGTYGGDSGAPPVAHGSPGGSGGGGGGCESFAPGTVPGGSGNTPPVSPSQGNNGGTGAACTPANAGGGGGGAGSIGVSGAGPACTLGDGGCGVSSSINGTPTARAGGGGGGQYIFPTGHIPQGKAGGGNGGRGNSPYVAGCNASANTGGGGGGTSGQNASGNGGSGVVIIRYKYQ